MKTNSLVKSVVKVMSVPAPKQSKQHLKVGSLATSQQTQQMIMKSFFTFNSSKFRFSPVSSVKTNRMMFPSSITKFMFCQGKIEPVRPQQIPLQNRLVVRTQDNVEDQNIDVFHSKGTLSIMDRIPGVKSQSGDLYALMFTCGPCGAKQIKTFTKHSYNKGVVLARCQGCQKIHLVADNLGWFDDKPVNVESLHKDQVKKIHDPLAVNMFMQRAFGKQKQILKSSAESLNVDKQKII